MILYNCQEEQQRAKAQIKIGKVKMVEDMKKLNEENARFAVVKTAFHGGGIASMHTSLSSAFKSARKNTVHECICGCAEVFPVTAEAAEELCKAYKDKAYKSGRGFYEVAPSIHLDENYDWSPTLLSDLKDYRTGNESPYEFVK